MRSWWSSSRGDTRGRIVAPNVKATPPHIAKRLHVYHRVPLAEGHTGRCAVDVPRLVSARTRTAAGTCKPHRTAVTSDSEALERQGIPDERCE